MCICTSCWCVPYYWGEPERAPRSHDVYCISVRACVRTYLRTCVRVGEACLGTSEVCNKWLRARAYRANRGLPGNESMWLGSGMSAVLVQFDRVAENERIDGEPRTPAAWQHSGAAIIKKKRLVPEKFCPCTCSYEGEVSA